jgi:Zn-finger nucleic acid-binding protein
MALECPRCQGETLDEIEVGGVILDRCPRCAGIWFDNAEINEIAGKVSEERLLDSIVPPPENSVEAMFCPRCENVSLRKLFLESKEEREYIVYRCVSCIGSWLDRGELREQEDGRLAEVLKNHFSKVT